MKTATIQFLKACSLSVALLGSAAVVLAISLPDVAYANNGKGGGGGKGNGGGNGKSASSGNSGGSSVSEGSKGSEKSRATKKKAAGTTTTKSASVTAKKAAKIKPKAKLELPEGVAHPSELGALNAAHASAQALENAAPNSRVGRIAAYRDAVLMGQELQTKLDEKMAEQEALDPPTRTMAEINDAVALAEADVKTKTDAVALLEAQSAAANGMDPKIEADLATARGELTLAETEAAKVKQEQADAIAYETLSGEITDLAQQIEDQPMLERTTLEAAANKPVTDEVEATVRALLGL